MAGLETGGRLSEVRGLKWDDVDFGRGLVTFDQTNTKTAVTRRVPMSDRLRATLKALRKVRTLRRPGRDHVFTLDGQPLGSIRTAFTNACRRAGLEGVTPHVLRHTFASWFMMNGGDLYRLQQYLGHHSIALTQRYAHLSADYLAAGVAFIGAPRDNPCSQKRGHAVVTKRPNREVESA